MLNAPHLRSVAGARSSLYSRGEYPVDSVEGVSSVAVMMVSLSRSRSLPGPAAALHRSGHDYLLSGKATDLSAQFPHS
jgi:hypothetical protein